MFSFFLLSFAVYYCLNYYLLPAWFDYLVLICSTHQVYYWCGFHNEFITEVNAQLSPEVDMQPSSNVKMELSTNVKTDSSQEVKVWSSTIIEMEPSKSKRSIFTRFAKRMGACLCLNHHRDKGLNNFWLDMPLSYNGIPFFNVLQCFYGGRRDICFIYIKGNYYLFQLSGNKAILKYLLEHSNLRSFFFLFLLHVIGGIHFT